MKRNNNSRYESFDSDTNASDLGKGYDDFSSIKKSSFLLFGCFGPRIFLKRSQKITLVFSIFLIVFIILVTLLGLYNLNQIVSLIINKSSFDVQLSQLSDIRSDSFNLVFTSNIYRTGPVVAALSPSWMYLVDQNENLIGKFFIPAQTLDGSWGSTPIMSIDTNFEVMDPPSFSRFMISVMNEEIVPWHLIADINVSVNLFPGKIFSVALDKTLMINGLNGFAGQQILFFDLPSEVEEGVKVIVKTKFINPSPIGMRAGVAGFKMYFREILIGQITLPEMNLNPGENLWELSGTLFPLSMEEVEIVNFFFNDFIKGKDSIVKVVGEYIYSSTMHPDESTPWLQEAFGNLVMTLSMPGLKGFNPITKVELTRMFIDFSLPVETEKELEFPIIVDVLASYALPFGFPIKIIELSQEIFLYRSKVTTPLALTVFPLSSVSCNADRKEIFGKIQGTIRILKGSSNEMSSFLYSIMTEPVFPMRIEGSASSILTSKLGNMTLKDLVIQQSMNMRGMNSFTDPPTTIKAVRLLKANPTDGIFKEIDLEIYNPSNVGSNLGHVEFDLFFENQRIGVSSINPLILVPGTNQLRANGLITLAPHTELLEKFLSMYIHGERILVEMRGSERSSSLPLLLKTLSPFSSVAVIHNEFIPLVEYCKLSRSLNGNLFVKFRVVNPMDVPVTLTGLSNFSIYYGELADNFDPEAKINSFDVPVLAEPVTILPRSSLMISEWIPMDHKASFALEKRIAFDIAKSLYFQTCSTGVMHILLDEFPVKLYYEQRNIKVYLGIL